MEIAPSMKAATPFSNFFPMTHGPRIVTNPHDPWGMHWCTLVYTPWVMGYYFPTFYGSYHTFPDYGFPITCGEIIPHDPWGVRQCTPMHAPWVMGIRHNAWTMGHGKKVAEGAQAAHHSRQYTSG